MTRSGTRITHSETIPIIYTKVVPRLILKFNIALFYKYKQCFTILHEKFMSRVDFLNIITCMQRMNIAHIIIIKLKAREEQLNNDQDYNRGGNSPKSPSL